MHVNQMQNGKVYYARGILFSDCVVRIPDVPSHARGRCARESSHTRAWLMREGKAGALEGKNVRTCGRKRFGDCARNSREEIEDWYIYTCDKALERRMYWK